MRKLLGAAIVSVLLLQGCSSVRDVFRSDKKKASAPVELVEIEGALKVERVWSESLGGGEGRLGFRQRPAYDGTTVYAATDDGGLVAIDAETGDARWESDLEAFSTGRGWKLWQPIIRDGGLQSSIGVGAGLVAVAGRSGVVYAVSADTGEARWETQASGEVLAAPLITNGLVVVRSQDGRVLALNPADGKRRWSFERAIPSLTSRGASAPISAGGLIIVGNDDGTVIALRPDDGIVVWEAVVSESEGRSELDRLVDVDGDFAVGADSLYATSVDGTTSAIGIANGRVAWTRENGGATRLDLTADGVLVSDMGGTVWSLDRASGSALWRQEGLIRRQPTGPVVSGSYAVIGDVEGYLHWVDASTGEFKARERVGRARLLSSPIATPSGIVIAVTDEGRLAAFRLVE